MENKELKEAVAELKGRYKVLKPDEVDEYLRPLNIGNKELIEILGYFADDYIFMWLDYIGQKLPGLATENNFLPLLKKIILKIKNDMAQGPIIQALIKIGENDPKLGLSLFEKMMDSDDVDLIFYSSFPLGGGGRNNFDETFSVIKAKITSENPFVKSASIRAIRVIFENKAELEKSSEIIAMLNRLSSVQENDVVQIEVLNAYFDLSKFRYTECVQKLTALANQSNSNIRFRLANMLWLRSLEKPEDEIGLLTICAKDDNRNVLSKVSSALSIKGRNFPELSMRIIRDWILRGKYSEINEIGYCLGEIGKVNLSRCMAEIEIWVTSKDSIQITFFIPIMLQELGASNYEALVSSMGDWPSRSSNFWGITLQTIKKVLSQVYLTNSAKLVELCFNVLSNMATSKGLFVADTIKNEPDRLFQCFRLTEELTLERKNLDFGTILDNLTKYEAITAFLGVSWFEKMQIENNITHPLIVLLSHKFPNEATLVGEIESLRKEEDEWKHYLKSLRVNEMLRPSAFLDYLNSMLTVIISKSQKLKDLKAGLRDENRFWATISEIEVIGSFLKDHTVEIAPSLMNKKIDLSIELEGKQVLVEIINPEMFKPLRYLDGRAIGLENRAKNKIYHEFKAHIAENRDQIQDKSAVIIIDIGRSEIDYDFVEDYLFGTLQLTMLINKETGKVEREYPSRAEDSMHKLKNEMDVLSAVICYKTSFNKDLKFHRQGKIILNPYARTPLSSTAIELIQNNLFV